MPTPDEALVDHGQVLVPALLDNQDQRTAGDAPIAKDQQDVAVLAGDVAGKKFTSCLVVPGQVPGRLIVERPGLLEDRLEVGPDRAAHG